MTKHGEHQAGSWRGRRAAIAAAAMRPLMAAGAAGVLAVAMVTAGVLAGAAPAGAAPAPPKSAALARAEATGFAGLHGGHASGKATGRSTVIRTARLPVLNAAQLRTQRLAARMPVLTPQRAQGGPSVRRAAPTSPAMAGAGPVRPAAGPRPYASTDFNYFRAQNVSPGNFNDGTNEPSVANDGNDVLYTGNWYAAESTDSGHTFSYIDPYTLGPAPTLPNGGFCCDQVAIHAPANGITAWGLLYCPTTCGASATATGKANIGSLPIITSVSPASGTHAGGTTVTITGSNFTHVTAVKFGTTSATFTVNSATKITVKTPVHATGTVDVRVTTKYGTSLVTGSDKYTFT